MKTTVRLTLPALLSALAGCSSSGTVLQSPDSPGITARAPVEHAAQVITEEGMRSHIDYLASDELGGRDTPSGGLDSAAAYLAEQFRALGLRPAGDDSTFFQRFPYESVSFDAASAALSFSGPEGEVSWTYASDFLVLPAATATVEGTPLYGGTVPTFNEAPPEAVRDRIVIVAIPPGTPTAAVLGTVQSAATAGAQALLLVLSPEAGPETIAQNAQVVTSGALPSQPLPAFGLRDEPAQAMFQAAGLDLPALRERSGVAEAVALDGITIRLALVTNRSRGNPANVVAVLPGSDSILNGTYVLLTAHFDHVGVGAPDATGDSIYNGADDNASGTAAILEAAKAFASMEVSPRRSVAFLLVSGEEKGLLGSEHYAENPTIPLDSVVANINLDMVSRNSPDTVIAIGEDLTTLGESAREILSIHPSLRLVLAPDPDPSELAFFRSDHISFVRKAIPAIFFTSWLHDDYHTPADESDRVDIDKATRVARLVFYLAYEVAQRPGRPAWTAAGAQVLEQVQAQMNP